MDSDVYVWCFNLYILVVQILFEISLIQKVLALAVLNEYSNTAFVLVYKHAQLGLSFKGCNLCGIEVLMID